MACDDLRSLWSSSNLHASERKFFTVWPSNASRRKLVSVLFSFVRARVQGCTEMAFLLLALNLRVPAIPFGHSSQVGVHKFTFPNLRWLATPFGRGLSTCLTGRCVGKRVSAQVFMVLLKSLKHRYSDYCLSYKHNCEGLPRNKKNNISPFFFI